MQNFLMIWIQPHIVYHGLVTWTAGLELFFLMDGLEKLFCDKSMILSNLYAVRSRENQVQLNWQITFFSQFKIQNSGGTKVHLK